MTRLSREATARQRSERADDIRYQGETNEKIGTDLAASRDHAPQQFAPFLPIFFILIIAVVIKSILRGGSAKNYSYERRDRLFSRAERSFLGVLEQMFGKEYRIIGKVRIRSEERRVGKEC